jgi:outer membrane protein assembly factor BamD
MNAISEYIVDYPESDRLASCRDMLTELGERLDRKAYEGARLYYKMEDYLASRVAFRNVLKDDADNIFREDILYYVAMSSYKYALLSVPQKQKERYLVFIDDYLNFVGENPMSPYKKELDVVYRKAQKALGRYSVEVDDIEMNERQFARERKKLEKVSTKK